MKKNALITIFLIETSLICCGGQIKENQKTDYIRAEDITDKHIKIIVEKDSDSPNSIVYFSNIVYEYNGSTFIFPVFGGTMGDVRYQDIRRYAINKQLLDDKYGMGVYIFQCKQGEVKKQLHQMLNFYQEKFSKNTFKGKKFDIKNPDEFFIENQYASFCYNLNKEWGFTINFYVQPNSPESSNPYEAIPDEKNQNVIYIGI